MLIDDLIICRFSTILLVLQDFATIPNRMSRYRQSIEIKTIANAYWSATMEFKAAMLETSNLPKASHGYKGRQSLTILNSTFYIILYISDSVYL